MDYVVNFDLLKMRYALYSNVPYVVHIHIKKNIQVAREHCTQYQLIGT